MVKEEFGFGVTAGAGLMGTGAALNGNDFNFAVVVFGGFGKVLGE
jgi:hypothetical protein